MLKVGKPGWWINFSLACVNFLLMVIHFNKWFLVSLIVALIGMVVCSKVIELEDLYESLDSKR